MVGTATMGSDVSSAIARQAKRRGRLPPLIRPSALARDALRRLRDLAGNTHDGAVEDVKAALVRQRANAIGEKRCPASTARARGGLPSSSSSSPSCSERPGRATIRARCCAR